MAVHPRGGPAGFEPSQIAVIVNTLLDAILPQIEFLASDKENTAKLAGVGLSKAPGVIGQRETYPDYVHVSGKRVELKGLFVDNPDLALKRPPTDREPSARLKENITMDVIDPANDALLVAAVQLRADGKGRCSPYVTDIGVCLWSNVCVPETRALPTVGVDGSAVFRKWSRRPIWGSSRQAGDSRTRTLRKIPTSAS